jgi:uncharacterized protein (UPF0332 family)
MRTPQILTDEKRKVLIEIRPEKARQTASDAAFAMSEQRWLMAVNRIYYAMFYATSALALQSGFSTSKHKQLHSWFNQHFIATSLLDKELYKMLIKAFEVRSDGDYEDLITFTASEVQILFENMATFNATLEAFIRSRFAP